MEKAYFGKLNPQTKYELCGGKDTFDYLKELCQTGLQEKYGGVGEEARKRLDYELDVIKTLDFADYFITVWDIVRFAKSRGIAVGAGRGSAAGSIVCFVLGITNVDPIRSGLVFERFINPEQTSMSEINIDLEPDGVEAVAEYAKNKYGEKQANPQTVSGELFRMDFIALRELAVIKNTVKLIKKTRGIDVDINNIDCRKCEVYDLIAGGDTEGVFQLDSENMQLFMRELEPNSLEDITAGIVLCRPSALQQMPRFIKNKNNPKAIVYRHPFVKDTLDVTYGCILYQEQIMQIMHKLAGYSLGRADIARRDIGKKIEEQTEAERKSFIYGSDNGEIKGCVKNGIDEAAADAIFSDICNVAYCSFNKSHAAAYAFIAYQMAYLKAFYRAEFSEAFSLQTNPPYNYQHQKGADCL